MQLNLTTLIIASLATYRLTRLITIEEGPFALALKLRGIADPDQRTWIGRGMACVWCVSFWIAPATLYAASYEVGAILVGGLAVSALVGLLVQCGGYLLAMAETWRRRRS